MQLLESFLWFLFKFGKTTYSKEGQVNRLLEVLKTGDSEQAAKVFTSQDSEFKITADSIQAYVQFIKENPTYLNDLETFLSREGEKDNLLMVQKGKTMFFFDNYNFVLVPVYMELHTNYKDTTFLIDGQEVQVSDREDYSAIGGLMRLANLISLQ